MKRPPKRIQLLGFGLAIVTLGWAFDMLAGSGPAAASAAQFDKPEVLRVPMPPDPPDRAKLEAFLTRADGDALPLEWNDDIRDAFVPTAAFSATRQAANTLADGAQPASAPVPSATTAAADAFRAAHKLKAVILGQSPMAMIDDRLHRVGARISGFRIDRILRDRVLFSGPEGNCELRIPRPGTQPLAEGH